MTDPDTKLVLDKAYRRPTIFKKQKTKTESAEIPIQNLFLLIRAFTRFQMINYLLTFVRAEPCNHHPGQVARLGQIFIQLHKKA